MSRLNKVHFMMSSKFKRNIIAEFRDSLEDKLIRDISAGKDGKLTGDNGDFNVHTNDIRTANKDKSYHFFASDFIVDRVDVASLSGTPNSTEPHIHHFLPSADETVCYKNSLKLSVLPDHIPHPLEEEMAQKSTVHMLPISLNNEVSYEGCIHIMDEYVTMLNHWYAKAGRGCELDEFRIPVGGDQLTRCRLQGAKSLRAGAHTQQERFEQLYPVIMELFHTLQDFLEAHEDFVSLVGQGYFLGFVLNKFGMSTLDDTPTHECLPSNIRLQHKHHKEEVANRVMEDIVEDIFNQFDNKEQTTCILDLSTSAWRAEAEIPIHDEKVKVNVAIGDAKIELDIHTSSVKKGCVVKLAGITNPLHINESITH